MQIVISDTSPVRALQHLQLLSILPSLYGSVYVPEAVAGELRRPQRRFPPLIPENFPFFVIESPRNVALAHQFAQQVDPREAAALALAMEKPGSLLLIDERRARSIATKLGLQTVGVLGVLVLAKQKALVPAIFPLIHQLRDEIDFYLADTVVAKALRLANE